MTQARWLGAVAIVGGIALLLLAIFAQRLGLSALPTFGWKKLLASIAGCVAIVVGIVALRAPALDDDTDETVEHEAEEVR